MSEAWYRVVEYFDEKPQPMRVPVDAPSYLLGKIGEIRIVQVPKSTTRETAEQLGTWLKDHGVEALIVMEGVTFMKLRLADSAEAAVLDAHAVKELAGHEIVKQ